MLNNLCLKCTVALKFFPEHLLLSLLRYTCSNNILLYGKKSFNGNQRRNHNKNSKEETLNWFLGLILIMADDFALISMLFEFDNAFLPGQ
jgi:hypothetical protein